MPQLTHLQFEFNMEKFLNLVAYLCFKTNYLDPLKATKLLYLIDRRHLVRYGKPVLGDFYVKMDYGPVPSVAYGILRDSYSPLPGEEHANRDLFAEYIEVDKPFWRRYPRFKARKKPDLDVFSEAEVESIDSVINEHGNKTGMELSRLTHDDATCEVSLNSLIDYRLFFKRCPEANEAALRLLELEQEDRDFVSCLR